MRCLECGNAMESVIENVTYEACGLPDVMLEGVEVRRCTCGEWELVIPAIEELHAAIAFRLIAKKQRLTPGELRFLRKHLGHSSAGFAGLVGVDACTVSKWENGKYPIGNQSERLIRLLVLTEDPQRDYGARILAQIEDGAPQSVPIGAMLGPNGWEACLHG